MTVLNHPQAFAAVLAHRPRANTDHFAMHFLRAERRVAPKVHPSVAAKALARRAEQGVLSAASTPSSETTNTELSTGQPIPKMDAVDDLVKTTVGSKDLPCQRLGLVLPKRMARRAVTRVLVRRLARAVMHEARHTLPCGDWVVRLRRPIDPKVFPSASSEVLRRALRAELTALVAKVLPEALASTSERPRASGVQGLAS